VPDIRKVFNQAIILISTYSLFKNKLKLN